MTRPFSVSALITCLLAGAGCDGTSPSTPWWALSDAGPRNGDGLSSDAADVAPACVLADVGSPQGAQTDADDADASDSAILDAADGGPFGPQPTPCTCATEQPLLIMSCPDGSINGTFCMPTASATCEWAYPYCPEPPPVAPTKATGACPLVHPRAPDPPGGCPLVGRWFLNSAHDNVHTLGHIVITDVGSYYGGSADTDPRQTYQYDGAYSFTYTTELEGELRILSSCGDGYPGSGVFSVVFLDSCYTVILDEETQNECPGNRVAFAGHIVLTHL